MAIKLANQVRPMCDELIITEDGGEYSKDLWRIADFYLHHPRLGHIKNLDLGIKTSTGEFVGALDSDIVIVKGSMRDLCVPGAIVCGEWADLREHKGFWAWCFVSDRKILEDPRWAIPEEAGHEGLDSWGVNLGRTAPYIWSDKMSYQHLRARSYGTKHRLEYEAASRPNPLNREIDPRRHIQRLTEDPEYVKLWANEEERQT